MALPSESLPDVRQLSVLRDRKTMDGFFDSPNGSWQFKEPAPRSKLASHTLGDFKNDREKFDKES
jgi:hypothetical protein